MRPLNTPYHALGGEHGAVVPIWAQRRSVYRGAGRTVYLVETDRLDAAGRDLSRLAASGWDVQVERTGESKTARITLTHDDLVQAA